MKLIITSLLLLTSAFAYSQVNLNKLSSNICKCFQNSESQPKKEADFQIKECISTKEQSISNDIEALTKTPSDYIEFIKTLAGNCDAFAEYVTKHLYTNQNLTDEEYTENIYQIIRYFKQPSEYGKMPKSITLSPHNVGLKYNIILHKTYTDTIYKAGFHLLEPNDSLIVFDVKEKKVAQEFEIRTKNNSSINIVSHLRYRPKPDSIGILFNTFGLGYEQTFIIPEIRAATRKVISRLSSTELYLLRTPELPNRIIENLKDQSDFSHLFDLTYFKIESIKFPHIEELAREAKLLEAYELLGDKDYKKRQKALNNLFKNGSKTAYLIILTHWSEENSQENLDYILEHLTNQ